MEQPNIGIKISQLRQQKGFTQQELSDHCKIDIRTIQRIEAGNVNPRPSTLRLIAAFLEVETSLFNGNSNSTPSFYKTPLIVAFFSGIVYLLNWVFYMQLIPIDLMSDINPLYFSIIHLISSVLFYYGIYILGKTKKSFLMRLGAITIMILVPIFVYASLAIPSDYGKEDIMLLIGGYMGINGILLGIGLLRVKFCRFHFLYIVAGILQILLSPMVIFFWNPLLVSLGLWLVVPFMIILIIITYLEYKYLSRPISVQH